MKKKLCLIFTFMLVACLFAGEPKWKAMDMIYPKKLEKTIQDFNLTCTFKNEAIEVYKNEETSDWMYIFRSGSEESNDSRVWMVLFAYLGGKFDSCTKYSSFTNHKEAVKYLCAAVTEENTSILPNDCMGKSKYTWNNAVYIYYMLVRTRVDTFMKMRTIQSVVEIPYSEDMNSVFEKYEYFYEWFIQNKENEDTYKKIAKEYKQYLKDHK